MEDNSTYSTSYRKRISTNYLTDSCSHEYIEEAGTMNIFFRVGDKLITAPTSDRILDGITRKSLLKLAESLNIECEVRPIKVEEIKDAARNGELKEIFGSGTAAVINPILGLAIKEKLLKFQFLKCLL